MDGRWPSAAFLDPRRQKEHARTEEQREDRHELLIRKQMAGGPDDEVAPGGFAKRKGIDERRKRHREQLNVHHQDAEHGEPAQDGSIGGDARSPTPVRRWLSPTYDYNTRFLSSSMSGAGSRGQARAPRTRRPGSRWTTP